MNAIEIRGLTKSFRGLYALDSLTPANLVMCLAGGCLFAAGLGQASKSVLNKTSLV